MRYITIFLLLSIWACESNIQSTQIPSNKTSPQEIHHTALQQILDSAAVKGTILIFDAQANTYYSNDFEWAKQGKLPASTFKITNSIIALETKVVENDSTIFKWNGEARRLKRWEQDLTFKQAFHYSCVPCYQDIARQIDEKRMNAYLQKLDYGNMVVDSSSIDLFWLVGESTISPFEQVDFLKRFYHSQLPIAKRTENIMKSLMVMEKTDAYILSGKTGWAIRDGHNNGWFLGHLMRGEKEYFIATNIDPQEAFNMDLFPKIRMEVAMKAFEKLEIL